MTILILLVIVVLLWVAVLAPSAWRRFGEHQGVGSIDHFHHQLQLLEHAGPKTVAPAYRLHTAHPQQSVPADTPPAGTDTSRPKLVLLRPTSDADAADVEDGAGTHYQRVGVLDRPDPACLPEIGADLSALRREQARRRCTILLRCLCGVAISTGLIGLFPKLHLAWVFTGLSGLAAFAVIGLMAYARELQAEQQRRRLRSADHRFASSHGLVDPAAEVVAEPTHNPAMAGYPGAWDDDDLDLPRAAAR